MESLTDKNELLYNWQEVKDIVPGQMSEGDITEALAGEKKIALVKKGEALYAFAATCPHQGAKLCDGWLDAQGRLVCALHKYRFDPANGRNTSGEGYKLRTFPVMIKEGKVFVGL